MTAELVIISGKGGTGKTSVAASLAVLAGRCVVADCDVDAADMHLLLGGRLVHRETFMSGVAPAVSMDACMGCGKCVAHCRFGAAALAGGPSGARVVIDPTLCEGCGVCALVCPSGAVAMVERRCGEWYVSQTRTGPMVHARLGAAAENSGKLVSTVRQEARRAAAEERLPLVIVDGPPGIGCPVIASVTGASLALFVTEPTVSGEHDLQRVLALARHFAVPSAVCVNKWDINAEAAGRIEDGARASGAAIVGRIRYDPDVTSAQIGQKAIVETASAAAADVREMWRGLRDLAASHGIAL